VTVTELDTRQLSPGDVLPELGIDITAKLIVGGAIASRDFQDVHHDKTAAQALGSADLFMNILTTNGLVGRYVTDWAGRGARLKKLAIGLGVPNFPGDHMILSGRVATVNRETSVVEVEICGANSHGDHVTGRVSVELTRC
jgi:hypothetical protein